MEDSRRQTGQNNSHSQNGESRRTQSSGVLPGFEGMNFEEQRGQYEKTDNQQSRNEQSGQNAPANMNE